MAVTRYSSKTENFHLNISFLMNIANTILFMENNNSSTFCEVYIRNRCKDMSNIFCISESVDSLRRDGTDTPIVCVHT